MSTRSLLLPLLLILLVICLVTTANATVQVRFYAQSRLVSLDRDVPTGMAPAEAAVRALVAGPNLQESEFGITSAIPAGVTINKLTITDTSVAVDMSSGVLSGLGEAMLQSIFEQFKSTLGDFPDIASIALTCNGKYLSDYLPPTPNVGSPAIATAAIGTEATGLSGHSITIGPSHGRTWNGSGWVWQRSDPCGYGEAVLEDTNSIRLCQFLYTYLTQDGARVESCRQLDETDNSSTPGDVPWWKMSAQSWIHHLGVPCDVWGTSTGNCGADTAVNRLNDDIRVRPLYADYKGTDIYIACHTNAGGSGTATGTETYYDTHMEHPAWITASNNLATQVQNNVVSAIQNAYDSSWTCHGTCVKDSAGAFGEIRIPNRPACLIELAFHDDCSRDASYLTDDFFRSVAEWGLYKGVCAYFGTTPTWDKYSCEFVSDTIPNVMTAGQSYRVTITLRNRGVCWFTSRGFRLGAPSGSDPFTSFNRINIVGEVKPTQTYTYSFMMTAPTTPGTYTTRWQMVRDGFSWFGPAVSKQIAVGEGVIEPPDEIGTALPAKTFDWQSGVPNWLSTGWASKTACGYTQWYSYTVDSACVNFNRQAKWQSTQTYSGRGHWKTDIQVPCQSANVNTKYILMRSDGTDEGTSVWLDQCPRDGWYPLLDVDKQDLSVGGWRISTVDTAGSPSGSCSTTCGSMVVGAAGLHMYGDRWQYINDWTCLGAYSSTQVSDTHAFDESQLYLYPAVDRTHGDMFVWNGKAPGRVSTGDCNTANSLNFKGNAAAYGGVDNADAYGFAWMYAPAGAAPKFDIGSDDGNRVWLNGSLINDKNAARGLTRDQDVTASTNLMAGWNRVLFKIHNGTGSFEGTMSLRNGGDNRWNEPSVNVFDLGGYLSYGLGYEQDSWYPRIDVASFDGMSKPSTAAQVFTNNTTVTANGQSWVTGPVPLWKVMHYEWGYGLSGDTNYANVTSSGANWAHTQTGVTGHRRFHFFSVSQSHRTSFQSGPNSGRNGGANWADGGPASYMDVYVDNVAPQSPAFTEVKALATNKIDLSWNLPLDQGVGIAPGASEDLATGGDNHYRGGDVGVSIRRNGISIYAWGTGTAFSHTGLMPNTKYTYDIAARDNTSLSRGAWNNTTAYLGSTSRWTLSIPPSTSNVTCDRTSGTWYDTPAFTFTAVSGFGSGTVDHYLYAWDKSPTHTFSGSESSWSSGQLAVTATSEGEWYLHIQGFNGESVRNGTLDLGPYRYTTAETVDVIGNIWAQPNTKSLALKDKVVTAALPGMFWLEESDRSAAIKVISGTSVSRGDSVSVAGVLALSGTERALFVDIVDITGKAAVPAPVSMAERSLGGSSVNDLTPGVTSASGLYNIGLLVRICGKVTYANADDPNNKYCYIDDGSGLWDGSGYPGVKTICGSTAPPASGFAIITGIITSEASGGKVAPVLLIRDSNDIKPL